MTDEELDKLTDNALNLMRNENTEHLNDKEWQNLFMEKHDIVFSQYENGGSLVWPTNRNTYWNKCTIWLAT